MRNLLLLGGGGHARSIIDIIESKKDWKIIGFVGLLTEANKEFSVYKSIGSDKDLSDLRNSYSNAFIAVGQIENPFKRKELAKRLEELDFFIPSLASSYSVVSKYSKIKCGTSIGHGAIVNSGANIGRHCIINSKALIEHDSIIGDFCHISTGVLINGSVRIGSGSFIGSGTIIREGIVIPPNTVISSGKRIMGWPINTKEL